MFKTDNKSITRIALTAVVFVAFGVMFYPFLSTILMAALFAFAIQPLLERFNQRRSRNKKVAALITIFSFLLLIIAPTVLVCSRIYLKFKEYSKIGFANTPLYNSMNKLIGTLSNQFSFLNLGPSEGENGMISSDYLLKAGTWIFNYGSGLLTQLPDLILQFFIFLAALYFFITERAKLRAKAYEFKLLNKSELDQIIDVVRRSSYTTLVATAAIGSIQALIVTIGAAICGYHESLIIFIATFFFSFIPIIGAAPIALVLSMISFISGDGASGLGLLGTAMVAGTIDNVIKPYVYSSAEEDINPVISLLAIIGALIIYGFPGVLLGPILTSIAFRIIPILYPDEKKETTT